MRRHITGTVACMVLAGALVGADEPPKTHKVVKGPFAITSELKGVLQAETAVEVVLHPKEWSTFEILDAAAHGARVAEGDVVLRLDTEGIDKAIADLRADLRVSDLELSQAELALRDAEKTAALDLAAAERSLRQSREDLEQFRSVDRALSEKTTANDLKDTEHSLRYEREELAQLEKMYKADELTEETEEIVLTRQRHAVERAEFYLERARVQNARVVDLTLSRQLAALEDTAARAEITGVRAQASIPAAVRKQTLALEKTRVELARAAEKLARLEADRNAMEVKAPVSGIVYHGAATLGEWGDAVQTSARLRRGGAIQPEQVVMTIVKPRPVRIAARIAEKDLEHLRPGMKGLVAPVSSPRATFTAILHRIDAIPLAPDSFGAELTVALPKSVAHLMPGMHCTVTIDVYSKKRTIAVPASAVVVEPREAGVGHVYLIVGEEPAKRKVKLGRRSGDKIEVLEGLTEGDSILSSPPEPR